MKKNVLLIVVLLLAVCGWYFYKTYQNQKTSVVDTSGWKTYQDTKFGFSITYPEPYTTSADNTSFTLINPLDNTPKNEYVVPPLKIQFEKQPLVFYGVTYPIAHTLEDYQKIETAELPKGYPKPVENIVIINGVKAIHHPPVKTGGGEDYIFIHNDLVYEVLIGNGPFDEQIAQTLQFQ